MIQKKEKLKKELETIKEELKKEKESYQNAKNFLLGKIEYKAENLGKIPTRRIRREKKTVEGGVVTRTLTQRLQISTLRRRITINKLIKKFNKVGEDPIKGVRFIMGFEKARFLRYTGVRMMGGIDKLGGAVGMKVNPEEFHAEFNRGKANILAVIEKGEKTKEEQDIIDAIKKRINYYGFAYARQRANARVNPFIKAEKTANEDEKILINKKDVPTKKIELNPQENEAKL